MFSVSAVREPSKRRAVARRAGTGVAAALALLVGAVELRADEASLETRVKAAYIFNFLTFVEWEASGSEPTRAPMRVCVLGDDPVLPLLEELTDRKVKGRPLQVVVASEPSEVVDCHLLVVGRSESQGLEKVLPRLAGHRVLTVSDIPRFCRNGGMIGFVAEGGRVKIEINQETATQAGLRISAKLLEVARLVR